MKPKIRIYLRGNTAFFWMDANHFSNITRQPLLNERPVILGYTEDGKLRLTAAGRLIDIRGFEKQVHNLSSALIEAVNFITR